MEFAEKLQKCRKRAGMSQEQLAAALKVSRQAVSKWETGESMPDAGRLVALSRLFDVSVDALLKEECALEEEFSEKAALVGGCADAREDDAVPAKSCALKHDAAKKPKCTAMLVVGTVLSSLGALGYVVIWVLSTMIEGYVDATYTDEYGKIWHTTGLEFSFGGFVERYRLEAVCVVLGAALAAGAALLVFRYGKRHKRGFE